MVYNLTWSISRERKKFCHAKWSGRREIILPSGRNTQEAEHHKTSSPFLSGRECRSKEQQQEVHTTTALSVSDTNVKLK